MTLHLNNGAIKYHMAGTHNSVLNRERLVVYTKIIKMNGDVNRLQISEAIIVKVTNPITDKTPELLEHENAPGFSLIDANLCMLLEPI